MARGAPPQLSPLCPAGGVAIVPAPATASPPAFPPPRGQSGCAFYSGSGTPRTVRCEWARSNDVALTLTETGRARRVRISDTVRDPKAPGLAYGHTAAF